MKPIPERRITLDVATRLALCFGGDPVDWRDASTLEKYSAAPWQGMIRTAMKQDKGA